MDDYRFYVPDLLTQATRSGGAGGGIELAEDQSHHARTVLRLEGGERVVLFDGKGGWATGLLAGSGKARGKGRLVVEIQGGVRVEPPSARALTIASAVPKGERAEWLIEQASQLDVACVQWVDCDRSVVKLREGGGSGGSGGGGGKIEKWRRLAVESAKQCGRTHLLRVEGSARIEAVLAAHPASLIFWLEPREGEASKSVQAALAEGGGKNVLALVGPEGGWSEREWALLEAAAMRGEVTRVRLTQTVLRIETACAAIAAIVMSAG